jgi:putative ribosome biogenesis GTPase RsgA
MVLQDTRENTYENNDIVYYQLEMQTKNQNEIAINDITHRINELDRTRVLNNTKIHALLLVT